MATKWYCRATQPTGVPGTPPDSGAYYDLSKTQSGTGTFITNTSAGPVTPPTAGTHQTKTAAGTKVTFVTPRCTGFTCAGLVTFGVYAKESNVAANAARVGYARIGRLTSAGVYTWIGNATTVAELTTSSVAYTATVTPSSTVFAAGDRIVAEFYLDDCTGYNLGSGYTVTMTENAGFFVQVYETVVPYVSGSGALTAKSATISGAGTVETHGTGTLTANTVSITGAGTVTEPPPSVSGSGALTVAAVTIAGTGTHISIVSMLEGHTVAECAIIKAEQLCARCTVTEWTDGLGNTYTVTDPLHMMADGKCMEISVTAVDSYQQEIPTEDSYLFLNPPVRVWVGSEKVEDPDGAIKIMVARAVLDVNELLGK